MKNVKWVEVSNAHFQVIEKSVGACDKLPNN